MRAYPPKQESLKSPVRKFEETFSAEKLVLEKINTDKRLEHVWIMRETLNLLN